jgi:hypothetical protein
VDFRITGDELAFVRADRIAEPERVFEPGEFVIEIGGSSESLGAKRVLWRCSGR